MLKILLCSIYFYSTLGLSSQTIIPAPEVVDFKHEFNQDRLRALLDGYQAHEAKDFKSAFKSFKIAATLNGGNAEAMYILGLSYIAGKGTLKDIPLGIAYLDRAAKNGLMIAASWLVWVYIEGKIVPRDNNKAKMYSNILSGKELESSFWLGTSIFNAARTDEKRVLGLWLIISAAKAGYEPAELYMKENKIEELLVKIIIESNLHYDLRFHNGSDDATRDYELAIESMK